MVEIQRTNGILKKIFIVVMVTVVPIAIVVRLWLVIIAYWQLIFSLFLLSTGVIFIYFYFKSYSIKTVLFKIKNLLYKKEDTGETVTDKIVVSKASKDKWNFLITGITLEVSGFYFLTQFFKNH